MAESELKHLWLHDENKTTTIAPKVVIDDIQMDDSESSELFKENYDDFKTDYAGYKVAVAGTVARIDGEIDNLKQTATPSSNGLMSKEDKIKLNGLHNYELRMADTDNLGGVRIDDETIAINENGVISTKKQNLSDLNDVLIGNPSDNDLLIYNNGKWRNSKTLNLSLELEQLTNVDIDNISSGDTIIYDSNNNQWKNGKINNNITGITINNIDNFFSTAYSPNNEYSQEKVLKEAGLHYTINKMKNSFVEEAHKPATSSYLGSIMVGNTLDITEEGVLNYNLPTASQNTLGGVKIDNSTIKIANGVISSSSEIDDEAGTSATDKTWSAAKITQAISAGAGGDGTLTSISAGVGLTTSDGDPITSSGTIKAKLKSETASALSSAAMGSTTDRQYAVGLDADGYLSVNVPWTDTQGSGGGTVIESSSTAVLGKDNLLVFSNDRDYNMDNYGTAPSGVSYNSTTGEITVSSFNNSISYNLCSCTTSNNFYQQYIKNKKFAFLGLPSEIDGFSFAIELNGEVIYTVDKNNPVVDVEFEEIGGSYDFYINYETPAFLYIGGDIKFTPRLIEIEKTLEFGKNLELKDGVLNNTSISDDALLTQTYLLEGIGDGTGHGDATSDMNISYTMDPDGTLTISGTVNNYPQYYSLNVDLSGITIWNYDLLTGGLKDSGIELLLNYSSTTGNARATDNGIVLDQNYVHDIENASETISNLTLKLTQSSYDNVVLKPLLIQRRAKLYKLPIATSSSLGGIKVESNSSSGFYLSSSTGKLSLNKATESTLGGVKTGTGLSTDSNGTLSLNTATSSTLGGIKVGSGLDIDNNGVLSLGDGINRYITSNNYSNTSSNQFPDAGMAINLVDGTISAPYLNIYSNSHDLFVQGIRVRPNNAQDTGDHFIWIESHDMTEYIRLAKDGILKTGNGTTVSAEWSTSDRRVKHDINPLNPQLSLSLIDYTQTKTFKYNGSEERHYGMIAQEVREVLDDLGETDSALEYSIGDTNITDQRNIHYSEYIPHLINYVKVLKSEIESLRTEINKLKGEQ